MVLRSTLRTLAHEIAAWLHQIVPPGFTVEAVECGIAVRSPNADGARLVDVSPLLARRDDDRWVIATAASRMLDHVRDEVIETVRAAWPIDEVRAAPAQAYAEWHDHALSMGYRYDAGAVVASLVVRMTELRA